MRIKFRQKQFTIPEGHYTGPKDIDKVPGVIETVGKSALAGTGIGAVVGSILKDSTLISGATTGGKIGTIAGIFLKLVLNYFHNPMSSVKYQEVDRLIRREFGIYSAIGITVGDSLEKRDKLEDRFSFNDRNISNYKINFAIQDGSITMYTFSMTDKELDDTSKILDYYCKKYFGMEYSSSLINKKLNSYSVNIVFTNYQVISNFILELSKKLNIKINILDNKAIVKQRILENIDKEEIKEFSVKEINKYDLIEILGNSAAIGLSAFPFNSWRGSISMAIMGSVLKSLEKLKNNDIARIGRGPLLRNALSNVFLEESLKRLGKIEGFDYTVGKIGCEYNISLKSGLFIITVDKKSDKFNLIDKEVSKLISKGTLINRSDLEKCIIYTYPVKSKNEFELLLRNLFLLRIKFNVFER